MLFVLGTVSYQNLISHVFAQLFTYSSSIILGLITKKFFTLLKISISFTKNNQQIIFNVHV